MGPQGVRDKISDLGGVRAQNNTFGALAQERKWAHTEKEKEISDPDESVCLSFCLSVYLIISTHQKMFSGSPFYSRDNIFPEGPNSSGTMRTAARLNI